MNKLNLIFVTSVACLFGGFIMRNPRHASRQPYTQSQEQQPQKSAYDDMTHQQFQGVLVRDIKPFLVTLGVADDIASNLQQQLGLFEPTPQQEPTHATRTPSSINPQNDDPDEGFFTMIRNATNEVRSVAQEVIAGAKDLMSTGKQTVEELEQRGSYNVKRQFAGSKSKISKVQALAVRSPNGIYQIWLLNKAKMTQIPSRIYRDETKLYAQRQGPKAVREYANLLNPSFDKTPKASMHHSTDNVWCYTELTAQSDAYQALIKDVGITGNSIHVYAWSESVGDSRHCVPAAKPDGFIVTCWQKNTPN